MNNKLEGQELEMQYKILLLKIARQAIEAAADGQPLEPLDLDRLPAVLQKNGASFVTLMKHDQLCGCIGAIEAYQPLAIDVQEHAAGAATNDYRFPKLRMNELDQIEIEISYLSPKEQIFYTDSGDLIGKLVPGEDGVVMICGMQRATFLPQVWEKIPDPEEFLSHLSMKMGYKPDAWNQMNFEVYRYRVEKFTESEYQESEPE